MPWFKATLVAMMVILMLHGAWKIAALMCSKLLLSFKHHYPVSRLQ